MPYTSNTNDLKRIVTPATISVVISKLCEYADETLALAAILTDAAAIADLEATAESLQRDIDELEKIKTSWQRLGLANQMQPLEGQAEALFMKFNLLEQFNAHFDTPLANTIEDVRTAQRIRYQVYCIEHPHEKSDNPDGLEMDEFDSHAAQSLLIHRATQTALGTVRLILPVADELDRSFAVQQVMDKASLRQFDRLPLHAAAEVSRFSISRQFRRMAATSGNAEQADLIRNSGSLMRLGLIQALVRMSMQHGITHWCAAMEPKLLRMLSAMAIRFDPIGPLIEYHGVRQPCYCVIADVLEAVRRERPAFWFVLTNGGAFADRMAPPSVERGLEYVKRAVRDSH